MIRIIVVAVMLVQAGAAHTASQVPYSSAPTYRSFDSHQAEIGRLLFYDKILSGNRNISCGTCHHPAHGTSDGLPLGIGEGGTGLGLQRTTGTGKNRIERRVPRNAPALWNLGATDIKRLMHDGRISESNDYGNHFNTPAQEWLPDGLNSVLAAQALFPMTSETEMAGSNEENEVAGAANDRIDYAWPIIAKRVRTMPEYSRLFVDAFDSLSDPQHINIVHIANALAAFIATEFKSHDSPYDEWLHGDKTALTAQQHRGRALFFGEARCSTCHSGILFSSQQFKALGLPAYGPGRTRAFDPMPRDVGRMAESDRIEDAYRFRIPMLRNVALTAPYGHNGAYATLTEMVKHHMSPQQAREQWMINKVTLPAAPWLAPADFIITEDKLEMTRQAAVSDIAIEQQPPSAIEDIVAFLHALTGRQAATGDFYIPLQVPSGLQVDMPEYDTSAEAQLDSGRKATDR